MKFLSNLKNNFSLASLSLLIAIIVWFVISITQYPTAQKTIAHIPVSRDITGTPAEENGIRVFECDVDEVTVELLGSRTMVGRLNNENLEAYLDASNIYSTGTKSLDIKVRSNDGYEFEVQSVTPPYASVVMDKYDTREFQVEPQIPKMTTTSGKAVNQEELTCDPGVVSITGPSAQLDSISKVYAISDKEMKLDSSFSTLSDRVQLVDKDGGVIEQTPLIKLSTGKFNISVPVRSQKTVGLSVVIAGVPSGFDQDCIRFIMSTDSITLASNNSQSEIPDPLEVGSVNLSELTLDFSKTFSISKVLEPSSFTNISELDTVTVTLDTEGLSSKDIVLDQNRIAISNRPDSSYSYNVLTQKLPITVIGPEDVIDSVTADDIMADVNLIDSNRQEEIFSAPVTFTTKYSNVWAVTKSNVTIGRTAVSTEGTASRSANSNSSSGQ